eukprot:snap_masked-scaffold_14-processed-gene-1.28-mRNA-1 protein AED:0.19 eAED:1.00 QI:0/0/0/1/1/1/2/0/394
MQTSKFPPRSNSQFPVQQFASTLESGLGLEKTKGGADDKEIAYLIKQNKFLKLVLWILLAFFILLCFIFSFIYRINIIKREAISDVLFFRDNEHTNQIKLLDLELELKATLESVVHQTERFSEFRSYLEKKLGENGGQLEKSLNEQSHLSPDFTKNLIDDNDVLGVKVVEELDLLLSQFKKKNERAERRLGVLSKRIVKDIDEDLLDNKRFMNRLKKLGIKNKVDLQKLKAKAQEKGGDFQKHWQEIEEEEKEVSDRVGKKLQNFFNVVANLQKYDKDHAEMHKIFQDLDVLLKEVTLKDSNKETDLSLIINKVNNIMLANNFKIFTGEDERSIIDFLKLRIYEIKLYPHQAEISVLQNKFSSGGLSTFEVLKEVEKLALEHDIMLWLDEDEMD